MTIAELERAERSQAVCRDILGSGESFEALDAPRWLAELSARGPKPAEGFDSVPPLICPWRRFFARNLDLMLCTILPLAAAALLFRPNYQPQGFGFTVIRTLVTLAALFVAEPLLLHFWGTTPGKWLLGLSVESESGGRLSLGEAWGRTAEDAIYISPPTSELQLAAMSLVWGREGMGALDLAERQELLRRIKAAGFGGFDFEAAGLRLFCEAEYAGEPTAFGLTAAEDGSPPCLKLVFRVTEAGM